MKQLSSILYLFVLALITSGCVSHQPDKKSPKPFEDVPDRWASWDTNISEPQKQIFWADTFNDPLLSQAIRTAWSGNPLLISQAEQTLARGEEAVIIGANLSPQANLGVSGSRSKRNLIGFNLPNGSTSFTSNSFNAGLNIGWEIDLWGKLKSQKESAKKHFERASQDYEGARLSIAGQVAKTWFEIIENHQQTILARQTMEIFGTNQSFVANRFQKGLATSLENDLATSAFASAQASHSMRLRAKSQSIRNLQSLLGVYPDGELDWNVSQELPQLSLLALPSTPTTALENRPDIISSRLQLEASGFDLSASRLSRLPSLSITGGPGSRAENFEDLLDNQFQTWEVGGSLTQPLFQGGRIKAQIRRADALKQSSLANYRATALRAFTEVENLLFNESRLQAEEAYLQTASTAAKSASQISWDRYQSGLQDIFDALDSQRRFFDSESSLLNIRKQRAINRVNLFLGIGLPALQTEP